MTLVMVLFFRSPCSEKGLLSSWSRNLVNDILQSCNGPRRPTTRGMSTCYQLQTTCSTSHAAISLLHRNNTYGVPASCYQSASPSVRVFSEGTSPSQEDDWGAEYDALTAQRNKSIIMNPNGQGKNILPGGFVLIKRSKERMLSKSNFGTLTWIFLGHQGARLYQ